MLNLIFKLFLNFNATSLILIVYAINEKIVISSLYIKCINLPNCVSYIAYIVVLLVLAYISLLLAKKLANDEIEKGSINQVEPANNVYLPTYLGYFFVALSINNFEALVFIYFIIFIFTFFSQTLYFNPIFLIFGYKFYYVTTNTLNVKKL